MHTAKLPSIEVIVIILPPAKYGEAGSNHYLAQSHFCLVFVDLDEKQHSQCNYVCVINKISKNKLS